MRTRLIPAVMLLSIFCSLILFAQEKPAISPEDAAKLPYAVSLAGVEDSGTYYLFVNEESLGTMDYTWTKDGAFANHFTLSLGGQVNKVDTVVKPDAKGVWTTIEMNTAMGAVTMERTGRLVKKTFRGESATVQLEENTLLYDNYGPALQSLILKHYDRERGGKQPLSIFVAGSVVVKGELERLPDEEHALAGRDMTLEKYAFTIHNVDTTLLADHEGHILLEDVPSQKAYFVRKGYESLAVKAAEDPLLSKPAFEVKPQKNVMIPMRDKIKLATDLYLPDAPGSAPVILIRTPYGKDLMELTGRYRPRQS